MTRARDIVMVWMAGLLAPACAVVEGDGESMGPRGGVLTSDDGRFTIAIPEGALAEDVDLTIDTVECSRPDALMTCYEVGPVGLVLALPAEIVVQLDHEMLDDPDALEVVVERSSDWTVLADRDVDVEDETISASALYLSSFTVVAETP
jgi:hypothetical protein